MVVDRSKNYLLIEKFIATVVVDEQPLAYNASQLFQPQPLC
jgi:hypothetical protein